MFFLIVLFSHRYWKVPPEAVRSPAHVAAAVDATRQSLVLLQRGPLPFAAGRKVAVIGPHANDKTAMLGNYLGEICVGNTDTCVQTPYEGIAALNDGVAGGTSQNATGCAVNSTNDMGILAAIHAAASADVVIFVGGLDGTIEGESHDRHDISLPGLQPGLLERVLGLGKPTAIVLFHGGVVNLDAKIVAGTCDHCNGNAPAVISGGYPGFFAAGAIADALFDVPNGAQAQNRWGKTPVTWYGADAWDAAAFDMLSFDMAASPGRTYRYYDGKVAPQWPFGYGESYTTFALSASAETNGGNVDFAVTVKNTGDRAGDDVVLAYLEPHAGTVPGDAPAAALVRQLFGFERVAVGAGGEAGAAFALTLDDATLTDAKGAPKLYPGGYDAVFSDGVAKEVRVAVQCDIGGCSKV